MQIVIDIQDDIYTKFFDNGIQDNEIAIHDVCEIVRAIRLGTPLPKRLKETLDKIKAEIEKESEVKTLQLHWGEAMGLNKAIDIIDKYREVNE